MERWRDIMESRYFGVNEGHTVDLHLVARQIPQPLPPQACGCPIDVQGLQKILDMVGRVSAIRLSNILSGDPSQIHVLLMEFMMEIAEGGPKQRRLGAGRTSER